MAIARSILLALLVAGGGCAFAQPPTLAIDHEDQAFDSAKAHYRGHAPFAVAALSPFVDREWFVLSFFEYWTGYETSRNATKHYVIRRVSGLREGYEDGVERGATPATTTWALSDNCPKLGPAIDRFELRSAVEFTSQPDPPYDPIIVRFSTHDFPGLSFWAKLASFGEGAEVDLVTPYNEGYLGKWVQGLLADARDCFSERPPEIPMAEVPADP